MTVHIGLVCYFIFDSVFSFSIHFIWTTMCTIKYKCCHLVQCSVITLALHLHSLIFNQLRILLFLSNLSREEVLPVQKENEQPSKDHVTVKKPRKQIKEMEFITVQEFDTIPPYVPLACPRLS